MASRAFALGGIGLLGITTHAAAQATWTIALPAPDPAAAQPHAGTQPHAGAQPHTGTQARAGAQTQAVAPAQAEGQTWVRSHSQVAMPPDMLFESFAPFEMGPLEMQGMTLHGGKVAGAPYSAEAVTEMTQTLADGNRIVRSVTASVARDSEGRTRREQVLAAFGPWMPAKQPKSVVITDPVAGVSYMLDEEQKVAVKMPAAMSFKVESAGADTTIMVANGPAHNVEKTIHYKVEGKAGAPPPPPPPPPPPGAEAGAIAVGAGAAAFVSEARIAADNGALGAVSIVTSAVDAYPGVPPGHAAPEQKSLGTQTIEGVEATGTQSVVTIPAGAIGNEQPIKIVSEQWYSPALQVVVMSKRSDPRTGEMVYRLTQLDRGEPAAALFQVPSDYTIKDMDTKVRRTRKPEHEQ
jgi:hypothetical protein